MSLRLRLTAAWLYIAIYSLIATGIDHMEQHPPSRRSAGSEPVRPPNSSCYILRLFASESPICPELGGIGYGAAAAEQRRGAAREAGAELARLSFSSRRARDWRWTVPPGEGKMDWDVRRGFLVVS